MCVPFVGGGRGYTVEIASRIGKTGDRKVPKIVIAKTLGKKMKSTRKISQLLKSKGFQVSHVTVHTYLRKNLGVKPLKPKLTGKQKFARLTFCRQEKIGQLMIGAMYFYLMNLYLSCTIHRIGRTTEFG